MRATLSTDRKGDGYDYYCYLQVHADNFKSGIREQKRAFSSALRVGDTGLALQMYSYGGHLELDS